MSISENSSCMPPPPRIEERRKAHADKSKLHIFNPQFSWTDFLNTPQQKLPRISAEKTKLIGCLNVSKWSKALSKEQKISLKGQHPLNECVPFNEKSSTWGEISWVRSFGGFRGDCLCLCRLGVLEANKAAADSLIQNWLSILFQGCGESHLPPVQIAPFTRDLSYNVLQ